MIFLYFMGFILAICVSFLMFSLIVMIHELGHFSAARFFWVKVLEFWLWIPPKIKKLYTDKKWTIFTLNALPVWWFVRLKWESFMSFDVYDEHKKRLKVWKLEKYIQEKKDIYDKYGKKISKSDYHFIENKISENHDADNLINTPYYAQAIIILAWVFMNFMLWWVIFSLLFFVWIKPVGINTTLETQRDIKLIPTVEKALSDGLLYKEPWLIMIPLEDSIAAQSGIKEGDIVLSIYDTPINSFESFTQIVWQSANKSLDFYIKREKEFLSIKITPDSNGKIWSYISENIQLNENFEYKYSFPNAVKQWFTETYSQSILTLKALSTLLKKIFFPENQTQRQEAISSVSGPIGIIDVVNKSLEWGIKMLLVIAWLISINLAVFNLLPIPALDGWRFIFICINWVFSKLTGGKWIPSQFESMIHASFLLLLLALSIIIWYNDIAKMLG